MVVDVVARSGGVGVVAIAKSDVVDAVDIVVEIDDAADLVDTVADSIAAEG